MKEKCELSEMKREDEEKNASTTCLRGEVGDEVGKACWGQIVKVLNIGFYKICSKL